MEKVPIRSVPFYCTSCKLYSPQNGCHHISPDFVFFYCTIKSQVMPYFKTSVFFALQILWFLLLTSSENANPKYYDSFFFYKFWKCKSFFYDSYISTNLKLWTYKNNTSFKYLQESNIKITPPSLRWVPNSRIPELRSVGKWHISGPLIG